MKITKLNNFLVNLGFTKKGNNYKKKINDINYIINLQKSNYSPEWYINCSLDFDEGKKGNIWMRVGDKNKIFEKDLFDLMNENKVDFVVEKINEKFIIPFVNIGDDKNKIREYVLTKPGVIVNEWAKDYLDIKSDSLVF